MAAVSHSDFLQHYPYIEQPQRDSKSLWSFWRSNFQSHNLSSRVVSDTALALYDFSRKTPLPARQVTLLHLVSLFRESQQDERANLLYACTQWGFWRRRDVASYAEDWEQNCSQECRMRLIAEALVQVEVRAAFRRPTHADRPDEDPTRESYFERAARNDADHELRQLLNAVRTEPQATTGIRYHEALKIATGLGNVRIVKTIVAFCKEQSVLDAIHRDEVVLNVLIFSPDSEPRQEIFEILLDNGLLDQVDLDILLSRLIQGPELSLLEILLHRDGLDGDKAFSPEVMRELITHDSQLNTVLWKECWGFYRKNVPASANCCFKAEERTNDFLHTAVRCRRRDVVVDLLQEYPYLAKAEDRTKNYALKYLNRTPSGFLRNAWDDVDEAIRSCIVSTLISNEPAREVHEIARKCETRVYEFNLNLSRFDSSDFDQLVRQMTITTPEDKPFAEVGGVRYETALRLVKFPALKKANTSPPELDIQDHCEVDTLLTWLRDQKQVQSIKTLIVPDRLYAPHDWKTIHWCVRTFQVKNLDWRILDLVLRDCDGECVSEGLGNDVPTTSCSCLDTLESICLYTSGNKNTTRQWLGSEGLKSLTQLKTVKVRVVRNVLNPRKAATLKMQLTEKLQGLGYEDAEESVEEYVWNSEIGDDVEGFGADPEPPIPELSVFLSKYKEYCSSESGARRTKIAVVDDGMMAVTKGNVLQGLACSQIMDGKSFVLSDVEDEFQWYVPGNEGHGTQMASLISHIDPHCSLYIAQVCGPGAQMTLRAVEQAIRWAVNHWKVDIISLSLALRSNREKDRSWENNLKDAIQEAEREKVIVICSTMDEGRNIVSSEVLPAKYDETISIVGTDDYGRLMNWSQPSDYHYSLRGHCVALRDLDFVRHGISTTGSSIATATASGLASLIINCTHMAYCNEYGVPPDNRYTSTSWKKDAVKKKLTQMHGNDETKYILPENLYGDTRLRESYGINEMRALIRENFLHLIPRSGR